MRTSRFTEQQVVCRKLGISEQTFSRWKRKDAGIGVAELRRLRQVEDEHRRLNQLVARVPA
jgi:putative transposase